MRALKVALVIAGMVALMQAQNLLAIPSASPIARLDQNTGAPGVTGNVAASVFVALGSTPDEVRVIEEQTANGPLHFSVRRSDRSPAIMIPLIARSNTPYRVSVRSSNGVRVRFVRAMPLGGGERLMPNALNVRAMEGPANQEAFVPICEGPRISRGGNNTTVNNALLLQLEVDLPDELATADVTLMMQGGVR
jgi:hypothetical protein